MSACRDASEQSPAIQLNIDPTIASPVEIEYSPYNDPFGTQTVNLQPDSAGVATLDMEFPDGITDFDTTILIGQDRYGAHIERGQTLHVSITAAAQGDSKAVVTYSGKNAGISRVLTSLSNGFSLRDYFPLDADTLPPLSSIISSIERERESYSPQLDTIADQTHRSYYTRYINRHADAIKMMAINIYSNLAHTSPDTVAEYRRIMSSINPDDEIDVRTDLYSLWLNAHNPVRDNNDFTAYQDRKSVV